MIKLELGVAGTIKTKHIINDEEIDGEVNNWLECNPDIEIIDIKFSTSANSGSWSSDVLIIYRTESEESEDDNKNQKIGFE